MEWILNFNESYLIKLILQYFFTISLEIISVILLLIKYLNFFNIYTKLICLTHLMAHSEIELDICLQSNFSLDNK